MEVLRGLGLCQWRSKMKEMVGFVQRSRKQLCGRMQKLGQIGEVWWMNGEIVRDEMVQVVLWRNDKLECSTSELHSYFSKLTQARTEKQSFVYFDLKSNLKLEKCWIELYGQKFMQEIHGKWTRKDLSMWIQLISTSPTRNLTLAIALGKQKPCFWWQQ